MTGLASMFRATDPETSALAAMDALPNTATDRDRVLAVLRSALDGLTDFELAALMRRQQTSVGKRRGDLVKAGLVGPLKGVRRPSPSGSLAQVWVALP